MQRSLVMKFGGAATRHVQQFSHIAQIVSGRKAHFERIAVVVSAMGDTTDRLLAMARRVHPTPPRRESDMLITTGERISSSLLAMALQRRGLPAASFTGSQAGILTSENHAEARILDIQPWRLERTFDQGAIAVIAGFQGMSKKGFEITALGRGGSDTSAVAIALAIGAECVEFYKDVGGIYDKDPKLNDDAQLLSHLDYDQAGEIVAKGAKVLHSRALALAQINQLPLRIHGFSESEHEVEQLGTTIGAHARRAISNIQFEQPAECETKGSIPCSAGKY